MLRKPPKFVRRIISYLRKTGIFMRLMLVFIILVVLSTFFISIFNQKQYTEEVRSNTIKNLTLMMENAFFKLNEEKKQIEQISNQFALNENLISCIFEEETEDSHASPVNRNNRIYIETYLTHIKQNNSGIKAAIFISNSGKQYTILDNGEGRSYIRDLESFMQGPIYLDAIASQGYPVWKDSSADTSKIIFENPSDKVGIIGTVTVATQIFDYKTMDDVGVLLLCVYPSHFTSALSEYATTPGGNSFLVGNAGLIEGIGASFEGPPFPNERDQLVKLVTSKMSGNAILNINGERIIAAFCGNEDFPIHVLNLSYEETVLKGVRKLSVANYLVLCLVLSIGACIFYLVAMSIAYPIKKLIVSMHAVAKGDFDAMYKPQSNDEVGMLCLEFDRMVEQTKELIDKVYVQELKEKDLLLSAKNAELKTLQMQINPHFLYNTLDLIRWQSIFTFEGENVVSDMIEKFCSLLRQTLKGDQDRETLKQSLEYAELYLDVVNFRYINKIKIINLLQQEDENFLLPVFSLQPIIENTIKHGFVGMENEDKAIKIESHRLNDRIVIIITDNGIGMDPEQLSKLASAIKSPKREDTGIGLWNINQRLQLLYANDYEFEILSDKGGGTTVILRLPI